MCLELAPPSAWGCWALCSMAWMLLLWPELMGGAYGSTSGFHRSNELGSTPGCLLSPQPSLWSLFVFNGVRCGVCTTSFRYWATRVDSALEADAVYIRLFDWSISRHLSAAKEAQRSASGSAGVGDVLSKIASESCSGLLGNIPTRSHTEIAMRWTNRRLCSASQVTPYTLSIRHHISRSLTRLMSH